MSDVLKTLIVDDNPICQKVMSAIIEKIPDVTAVDVASGGRVALAKLRYLDIDLILLDIEMPRMDGIETLTQIKTDYPDIDVLMISSAHESDAEKVVRALELGAMDFLPKLVVEDENSIRSFRLNMLTIIGLIKARRQIKISKAVPPPTPISDTPSSPIDKTTQPDYSPTYERKKIPTLLLPKVEVIAIASSTGGPNSLVKLIPNLPGNIGVPILIVQHMPSEMTAYLASNLNEKSKIQVCEASDGETVNPDVIYIAPGGKHMTVQTRKEQNESDTIKYICLTDDPPENSVRPAADVLFRSIAQAYTGNILAVIMTGMGSDGLKGVQVMKNSLCYCISQTADTCVVYGMPKAVNDAGLSDEQVPLHLLAERIAEITLKTV